MLQVHIADRIRTSGTKMGTLSNPYTKRSYVLQTEFSHLGQKWAHFKITILLAHIADRIQSLGLKWAHYKIPILKDHIADRIQSFGTKTGTLQNHNTTRSFCRQNLVIWDKKGHTSKSQYYYSKTSWEATPW